MKKYLLLLILSIPFMLKAQTTVPGGLVSGTWTLAGSPYNVMGSIQIPNDSTLTIQPGVSVVFNGTFKLQVNGRLLAEGTNTDSISFSPLNTTTGWRGIRFQSTPTSNDTSRLSYCKFLHGIAGTSSDITGGAIYFLSTSKAVVSHSRFFQCSAPANAGGAIGCENGSSPKIYNNTISYCSASYGGGGIYLYNNCNPKIVNNIISNNTANNGGGLYINILSQPELRNNIIANNTSGYTGAPTQGGGGIFIRSSDPVFVNNTIVNNTATYGGGMFCQGAANPTFRNCIVWGNTASMNGPVAFLEDDNCDPAFYYSDVEGATAQIDANGNFYTGAFLNNINLTPMFVSPSGGSGTVFDGVSANWSLLVGSGCLDSGDPTMFGPGEDIIGNPRTTICRIDMGAYEYQSGIPFQVNVTPTAFNMCGGACDGVLKVTASGDVAPYSFSWSTGSTMDSISGLCGGTYTLTASNSAGCTRIIPVYVPDGPYPWVGDGICLVTVDSLSTANVVLWQKDTTRMDIDSFRIYREVTTGVYAHIASVSMDSMSQYTDYAANPNTTSYKYKLGVIDTCGNVSYDSSLYHNTIHLQVLGGGNLQWTLYEIESSSNPVTFYRVLRDDLGTGNFVPISSTIPGGNYTYTDLAYASYPSADYRVDVTWSISCDPSRATVNTTRSNIRHTSMSVGVEEMLNAAIVLYPNPVTDNLTLELSENSQDVNVEIRSVLGQLIHSEMIRVDHTAKTKKQFDVAKYAKGVYTMTISGNGSKVYRKFVVK